MLPSRQDLKLTTHHFPNISRFGQEIPEGYLRNVTSVWTKKKNHNNCFCLGVAAASCPFNASISELCRGEMTQTIIHWPHTHTQACKPLSSLFARQDGAAASLLQSVRLVRLRSHQITLTKMQHFPFIFNGTPCGTAPTVVDTSGDNFGHRLLPAPEVEPSLVFFGHHSLHHTVAASDLTHNLMSPNRSCYSPLIQSKKMATYYGW